MTDRQRDLLLATVTLLVVLAAGVGVLALSHRLYDVLIGAG